MSEEDYGVSKQRQEDKAASYNKGE